MPKTDTSKQVKVKIGFGIVNTVPNKVNKVTLLWIKQNQRNGNLTLADGSDIRN